MMTRYEAVRVLSELADQCAEASNIFCTEDASKRCEAVDMAIEMLEARFVRCRDCVYLEIARNEKVITGDHGKQFDVSIPRCPRMGVDIIPNGGCSYGERRNDDD